jgi:hypothetical protein
MYSCPGSVIYGDGEFGVEGYNGSFPTEHDGIAYDVQQRLYIYCVMLLRASLL